MKRTRSFVATEIDRALLAASEAVTWTDLGTNVLPHLERALDSAGTLLYRYDETSRLAPVCGNLAEVMRGYGEEHWRHDPAQAAPRRMAPALRVVLVDRHVDPRELRASAAYGDFYARLDLEHLACAWITALPYGTPGMSGVLFTRPRAAAAFSDEEGRTLRRVLPALAAAARRADRYQQLERRQALLETVVSAQRRPELMLSTHGALLWATPEAEQLLAGGAAGARTLLPESVRQAARRLGDFERCGGSTPLPELTIPVSLGAETWDGCLSLARAPGGGRVIRVELEGHAPRPGAARTLALRFGLTPAEARVLAELAFGLSNPEIAERLGVGVETVRTHVQRILEKLGVRSRVEAAVRARRLI
jgi:DNA-binding CsgD family transcriptional regulator